MLAKEFIKPVINRKLLARIFSKIRVSTENFYQGRPCWEWQAAIVGGYGVTSFLRKNIYAHRFIYQLFVEPIPIALQCDHLCRNRKCIRPDHIEIATPRENTLRGESIQARNATKTHCIHGHEFDEKNTYRRPEKNGGGRACRRCHVEKYSSGVGHNRDKTYCKNGHPFSPENTYLRSKSDGKTQRVCRICQRNANRRNQPKYKDIRNKQRREKREASPL